MASKKYLPSLGFIILAITIVCSLLFVKWALGPLSYEKAQIEENKGHQLAKVGKNREASKYFLNAAKIEDDNISTSRRYRCAGTTASKESDKIKYYQLALKYNPKNQNAKKELSRYFQEIRYINRYPDNWSKGRIGKVKINAIENSNYTIQYFTSSPEQKEFTVTMTLNNNVLETKTIKAGIQNNFNFELQKGTHTLNISINHTFNPKVLNMSSDNRNLGVHYVVKKGGIKSE